MKFPRLTIRGLMALVAIVALAIVIGTEVEADRRRWRRLELVARHRSEAEARRVEAEQERLASAGRRTPSNIAPFVGAEPKDAR